MKRLDYFKVFPDVAKKLAAAGQEVDDSGLNARLRVLVELRVSQINGCVYCVDMHNREARELGETQRRLDSLVVWHDSPFFNERERAAFTWAESLTHISQTRAPDADYEALAKHFSEHEIVALTFAISLMNAWNRIALGFRKMPE